MIKLILKKYTSDIFFRNALWIMLDKLFVLLGGLLVTISVAKYLGPNAFGQIAYGIALSGLPIAICQWGANHIICNIAVSDSSKSEEIIFSTENIRFIIYVSISILISLWVYEKSHSISEFLLISLSMFSSVFLGIDVAQFHFNGISKSKINASSSFYARVSSILLRTLFVFMKLKPIFFVIPYFLNNFIIYFLRKKCLSKNIKNIQNIHLNRFFLKSGFYFVITAILSFFSLKANELLLTEISSYSDMAVYNMALMMSMSWTFIPLSIGLSYISKTISNLNVTDKHNEYAVIFCKMILCSLPIIIFVICLNEYIISFLFDENYKRIISILPIMMVAGLLSSLNVICNRMIGLHLKGDKYLVLKTVICTIIFPLISYNLITHYGLKGAAYSLFICEFVSLTIFNYLFGNGFLFVVQLRALFPWFLWSKKL